MKRIKYAVVALAALFATSYNNFPWEGWRPIGNGTWTASSTGTSFYGFRLISRCNNVVNNIDRAKIADKKIYNNLLGQALAIRAYAYARMNFWYGGVPIMDDFFISTKTSIVPSRSFLTLLLKVVDSPKELHLPSRCATHSTVATGNKLLMLQRQSWI